MWQHQPRRTVKIPRRSRISLRLKARGHRPCLDCSWLPKYQTNGANFVPAGAARGPENRITVARQRYSARCRIYVTVFLPNNDRHDVRSSKAFVSPWKTRRRSRTAKVTFSKPSPPRAARTNKHMTFLTGSGVCSALSSPVCRRRGSRSRRDRRVAGRTETLTAERSVRSMANCRASKQAKGSQIAGDHRTTYPEAIESTVSRCRRLESRPQASQRRALIVVAKSDRVCARKSATGRVSCPDAVARR